VAALDAVREDFTVKGPLNHKGLLVGEMVVTGGIVALSALTSGAAPKPSQFIAPFALFEGLAIATDVGPNSARVAAALGALVTFGVLLAHAGGLISFTNWLTGGGPTQPATGSTVGASPPNITTGYNVAGPLKPHGRPIPTNHGGG
jgi:hypothetical protein